ncbi:MAG: hypothetical protein NUV52_04345 [Candidatus Roizmanbacteria bacterium]|nr:hypothetical protein [Candidatus Roizmanbacteria bacterium]
MKRLQIKKSSPKSFDKKNKIKKETFENELKKLVRWKIRVPLQFYG